MICEWCRQPVGDLVQAMVYGEPQGEQAAMLCASCYDLPDARHALAMRFLIGQYGERATLVWYRFLPDRVAVLRTERDRAKIRGLATFLAGNLAPDPAEVEA